MSIAPPLPNTALVAKAALAEILGSSEYCGKTLPEAKGDGSFSWAANGFAQITPLVGSRNMDVPMRYPIVSIDCWVVAKPGSNTPPWGRLNNLCEQIIIGAEKWLPHRVLLGGAYPDVQLFTIICTTEPRNVPDLQSFGHMNFHMNFNWAPVNY